MMKKTIEIMFILVLCAILFVPAVHAWKWETHQYLAELVCDGDAPSIDKGAIAPDNEFKDFVNHHVYGQCNSALKAEWCDGAGCFDCTGGNIIDSVAIDKAQEWILKLKSDENIYDKSYDCGVASHYFFDSKVYFHQTKSEKESCHSGFEAKVNERIKAKDYSNWTECDCEACISYSQFAGWIAQFNNLRNSTNTIIQDVRVLIRSDEPAPAGFLTALYNKYLRANWLRMIQWW